MGFITWIAFVVDRSEALNAQLERRVAERTAALQAEVSERKNAAEALHASEQRYGLLFSEMVVGLPCWKSSMTGIASPATSAIWK